MGFQCQLFARCEVFHFKQSQETMEMVTFLKQVDFQQL